ncbi:thioesterase family protein [Halomonas sp. HNIBRBA4712]|uniref:thioesterase family protein n=1 Tax=Halomonas sp. HNIBRBA4712 TaxID=3373087 RepID=UPI00374700CF
MQILSTRVASEWVDYNGHMNDAEYARVFSLAVDELMVRIGLDGEGRTRHGYTLYTLETHLCYRREAHEGQSLSVNVTLLNRDAKRLHAFFELLDEAHTVLATSEQMLMGIDVASARPAPFPAPVLEGVTRLPACDENAWPALAGRTIGIR